MHVALGYHWFEHHAAYHIERAFIAEGCDSTYVGLPAPQRAGYDSRVDVDEVLASLSTPVDLYLLIDPAGPYFPRGIERLPFPTACYLIDVHIGGWRHHMARFFDVVFVAQKDYVDTYRAAVGHDQVYWLPLGAAPDIHYRHDLPPVYDVAFVGSTAAAHKHTNSRMRRLLLLSQKYRTNDVFAPTAPAEVGRIYSQARIVFNTSIAGDVTMRVFEGTACGALLVTDSVANGLTDLFVPGQELVVFEDDTDLVAKIDYYLAHEEERATIAAAGRQRTQNHHTYQHRVRAITAAVRAPHVRQLAPMRNASEQAIMAERRAVFTSLHMVDAVFDDARAGRAGPLRRAWAALPAIGRRILR
jgi:hypothetical protein